MDSHGRGTTTSPMGIRYPIPIPTVIRGVVWRDALKAGRDFESEKDGKRAERVLEKGAREKLKEMNQLEKEMDEWSPFDDVEEGRAASKRLELERSGFAPDRNYDGQAL